MNMQSLRITTAQNGYIVHPESAHAHIANPEPFVFESFESLSKWLSENLDIHTKAIN